MAPLSSNITLRMEGRLGQLLGASSVVGLGEEGHGPDDVRLDQGLLAGSA